jgi:FG-GAP-like repeat
MAALADMTGNGHLDMVLSNDQPDPKLVLLNDGKGNFTIGGSYGNPKWSTRNAAVGGLNGEGYPDIVVANREMTRAMAVADFDGDGHLDIAACHEQLGCFVYLNDGKGNFGGGIQFQTSAALPYP